MRLLNHIIIIGKMAQTKTTLITGPICTKTENIAILDIVANVTAISYPPHSPFLWPLKVKVDTWIIK